VTKKEQADRGNRSEFVTIETLAIMSIECRGVGVAEVVSSRWRVCPMAELADESRGLMAAARAGSREATGRALEACRRYLLWVAERELAPDLRSKGGASDLVQETFLEAQRDFARFEGSSADELRAWLRQVLVNNVGNFTRRYRDTSKRAIGREVGAVSDGSSFGFEQGLAGSTISPSGAAIEREQALALRRAVDRLPEDHRRVVTLRFEDGLTFEEIGQITNRSADAARKIWSRAMERLRQEWEATS
jgi:RNA polymerase sigma-70 factor (ECF subfamily)